jgi:hypothetical protein
MSLTGSCPGSWDRGAAAKRSLCHAAGTRWLEDEPGHDTGILEVHNAGAREIARRGDDARGVAGLRALDETAGSIGRREPEACVRTDGRASARFRFELEHFSRPWSLRLNRSTAPSGRSSRRRKRRTGIRVAAMRLTESIRSRTRSTGHNAVITLLTSAHGD